jgi:hypothetical protein
VESRLPHFVGWCCQAFEDEHLAFAAQMQAHAQARRDADADGDGKLDYREFKALVQSRAGGRTIDEDECRRQFAQVDVDGSGTIEMHEYVLWSLKDALRLSVARLVDLVRARHTSHAPPPPPEPHTRCHTHVAPTRCPKCTRTM